MLYDDVGPSMAPCNGQYQSLFGLARLLLYTRLRLLKFGFHVSMLVFRIRNGLLLE